MVGTVDCSKIRPDPEADEGVACLGLSLILEWKAEIDRAVEARLNAMVLLLLGFLP